MANDILYSVPANITIQGPRVLRLLDYQNDFALFDVVGFEEQIIIKDFRHNSIMAVIELEHNENDQNFAYEFMASAKVTIEQRPDEAIFIILEDTNVTKPDYMLWIAIGLEDNLPLYDYLIEYIAPFAQNTFAVVSLYLRPKAKYQSFEKSKDYSSSLSSGTERRGVRISSGMY